MQVKRKDVYTQRCKNWATVARLNSDVYVKNEQIISRNTLDIDNNDKDFISKILTKIIQCEHLIDIKFKLSSCKGYHLILFCGENCDKCRLVFDDARRFAYDLKRQKYARNVLFDTWEIIENAR